MFRCLLGVQEDWAKEATAALTAETQNQVLLMNVEYRAMGQVFFEGANLH